MGRVSSKKLTVKSVEAAKPGRHYDDHGLVLVVSDKGTKRWEQRLQIGGKRCDIGLGPAALTSLAQARQRALDNLRIAKAGGDPRKAVAVVTFADAAKAVITKATSEVGAKTLEGLRRSLIKQVPAALQAKAVADWTQADVLACLNPIWLETPATANLLRIRISAALDWAIATGHRVDNPADWRTLGKVLSSVKKVRSVQHRPAISISDAPDAFDALGDDVTGQCLRVIALCAARLGEIQHLRWDEIRVVGGATVLVIPKERTKTRVEHRIPLSTVAKAIIDSMPRVGTYVFGGDQPVSRVTLWKRMSTLAFKDDQGRVATVHGWRSCFRDWGGQAREDRDLLELALGHARPAVEAAYARDMLVEHRLAVMERWAGHLKRKPKVVRLHA